MNKKEITDNVSLNIEKERIRLGLTQKAMADALEISLTAYKQMINGTVHKIDSYTMFKLYELTGKMWFEFMGLDDRFLRMVSRLHDLSEQQLIYISAIIEFEIRFRAEHEDCDDYLTVFIPLGDMQDGMIYDSSHVEKINVAKYRKKFGNQLHYGIKITSNHLQPAYNYGDILLIAKEPVRDGDTGLFLNKDNRRLYIRRYRQTKPTILEPINEYGLPFELDDTNIEQWVKFGKVLTKIR